MESKSWFSAALSVCALIVSVVSCNREFSARNDIRLVRRPPLANVVGWDTSKPRRLVSTEHLVLLNAGNRPAVLLDTRLSLFSVHSKESCESLVTQRRRRRSYRSESVIDPIVIEPGAFALKDANFKNRLPSSEEFEVRSCLDFTIVLSDGSAHHKAIESWRFKGRFNAAGGSFGVVWPDAEVIEPLL